MGGGEIIIRAIQRVFSSIQELKDACQTRHIRGRSRISIKENQLELLLELYFSHSNLAHFLFLHEYTQEKCSVWTGCNDILF